MAKNETVTLTFSAKDNQSTVIKKINKNLKEYDVQAQKSGNSSSKLGGAVKGAIGAFAGYQAVTGVLNFAKESIRLAEIQIKAETRLAQTIKATGGAAGLSAEQLKNMASNLQSVTTVGDEAIIGAQSLLLTFKNIGGQVFPRVTEAVLDMSEAMGQDLKSSSIQLGKALNDPIKGVAALSRVGVQFSESQKEQIKLLQESNDLLGAQDIILKEVESQFGGVARAMAETDVGKITQMKNELSDIQEQIGMGLIPLWLKMNSIILDVVKGAKELTKESKIQKNILRKQEIEVAGEELKKLYEKQKIYNQALSGAIKDGKVWVETSKDSNQYLEESAISAQRQLDTINRQITAMKKMAGISKEIQKTSTVSSATVSSTAKSGGTTKKMTGSSAGNMNANLQAPDYSLLIDQMKTYQEDLKAVEIAAEEERKQREAEALEDRKNMIMQNTNLTIDSVSQIVGMATSQISKMYSKEKTEIDETAQKRKEDVKNSRMSQRQKAKEIEKIDQEAMKKKQEMALKQWRMDLAMSFVNTGLAIVKTIANMGMPAAIPMVVATAALGTLSSGMILANKPKFASGGIVEGTSTSGDNVDIAVNSGEMVLNKRQQSTLYDIATGKSNASASGGIGDVNIEAPTINIQGNVTEDNIRQIEAVNEQYRQSVVEALYQAVDMDEIDTSRLQLV